MFLVKLASICQQCSGNASGRIVGEIPLNKSESNQALICGLFSLLQSTPSCLRRWVKIRRTHSFADLEKCIGKYDVINIKLDKTGGLTEALKLKEKAKTKKFDIMVGCMVGTSLAMAPALILAQNVKWVDLDGPLLMSEDRKHNLIYKNSEIQPASTELWG